MEIVPEMEWEPKMARGSSGEHKPAFVPMVVTVVLDPSNRVEDADSASEEVAWYRCEVPEDVALALLDDPACAGFVFDSSTEGTPAGQRCLLLMEYVGFLSHSIVFLC